MNHVDIYRQSCSRLVRRRWFPENAKRGEETDVKIDFLEVFFSSVGARGASWKALLSHVYKPLVCSVPDAKPLAGYYPGSRDCVVGQHPGEAEPPAYASLLGDSGVSVFIQKLLSGRKLKSVNEA